MAYQKKSKTGSARHVGGVDANVSCVQIKGISIGVITLVQIFV